MISYENFVKESRYYDDQINKLTESLFNTTCVEEIDELTNEIELLYSFKLQLLDKAIERFYNL